MIIIVSLVVGPIALALKLKWLPRASSLMARVCHNHSSCHRRCFTVRRSLEVFYTGGYKSEQNTRLKASKIGAPPLTAKTPYPSHEYFRTHRGDFLISSSEPRYESKIDLTPRKPPNMPISRLPVISLL